MIRKLIGVIVLVITVLVLSASTASASHAWGNYHWARTGNPFNLKLGDNVSSAWDSYLATTSNDWSVSSVLDTTIVPGQSKGNCRPTAGRVEVCNKTYGNNGWLGMAQIWVSGSHITQGVVKANDTYFNTPTYNKTEWKNLVMCQEVGHTFGLDHQDEIFDNPNLGTCMDYTNSPLGPPSNEHPNEHDYNQLELIYAHLDSLTTVGQTLSKGQGLEVDLDNPGQWGRQVKGQGRVAVYERDFGGGHKVFTFVIWAD
ncbi:hypothetical protein HY503_00905 [Candidatus Woesebacteria bacterium]|nr:hypothetical protein [Candidatus Woesebacteria bacterium]